MQVPSWMVKCCLAVFAPLFTAGVIAGVRGLVLAHHLTEKIESVQSQQNLDKEDAKRVVERQIEIRERLVRVETTVEGMDDKIDVILKSVKGERE